MVQSVCYDKKYNREHNYIPPSASKPAKGPQKMFHLPIELKLLCCVVKGSCLIYLQNLSRDQGSTNYNLNHANILTYIH